MIDTIASVATAIGVAIAAIGIWQARRSGHLTFELTFNDRYRSIADRLPLATLQKGEIDRNDLHERALFDYLDLCEEQLWYRQNRRISSLTWTAWEFGMRRNLGHGQMAETCARLIAESPHRFALLQNALGAKAAWDPRRSWWQLLRSPNGLAIGFSSGEG